MPFINEILNYDSLSIVGLQKNTGKTVSLNYVLDRLPIERKRIAVTSIGIDGETTDQVTRTQKPEITLRQGMYFGTSEMHYRQWRIVSLCHDNNIEKDENNDSKNDSQKLLNERQKKIVMLMRKDHRISVSSIAASLSLSMATVYREIRIINTLSELYWDGPARSGHWAGAVFDSQNDS